MAQNEQELEDMIYTHRENSVLLDRLQRDHTAYSEIFTLLSQQREQAKIALIQKPIDIRIATRAITATQKIGPNRSAIVLITTLLCIVAATFLIYLREISRHLLQEFRDQTTKSS